MYGQIYVNGSILTGRVFIDGALQGGSGGGGGIPDAPADGEIYGRKDNGWVQVESSQWVTHNFPGFVLGNNPNGNTILEFSGIAEGQTLSVKVIMRRKIAGPTPAVRSAEYTFNVFRASPGGVAQQAASVTRQANNGSGSAVTGRVVPKPGFPDTVEFTLADGPGSTADITLYVLETIL